jgi:hypothetical protein
MSSQNSLDGNLQMMEACIRRKFKMNQQLRSWWIRSQLVKKEDLKGKKRGRMLKKQRFKRYK